MQPNPDDDLHALMAQSQRLQQQMADAQAAMAETQVTGRGGAAVSVTYSATGEPRAVSIDPTAVDPENVAELERLLLGALQDVAVQQRRMAENMLGPVNEFFTKLS